MDYINPLSNLPTGQEFENNNVPNPMSGLMQGNRAATAAPFIDMARQQQQLGLQQLYQETQEHNSPTAIQSREEGRKASIAQSQIVQQTKDAAITLEKEKARLAPYLTDKQIEDAKNASDLVRSERASRPLRYMAAFGDQLDKTPEASRPMVHNQMKQMFLQQHPEFKESDLPEDIRIYKGESTMNHLRMAQYAMVHDMDMQRKEYEANIAGEQARKTETVRGGFGVKEAGIHAGAVIQSMRMQINAGRFDNAMRHEVYLSEIIRTKKDPDTGKPVDDQTIEDAKGAMRQLKGIKVMEQVNKDPIYQNSALMALTGNPTAKARAEQARQDATQRALKMLNLSPEDIGQTSQPQQQAVPQNVTIGGKQYKVLGRSQNGNLRVQTPQGEREVKAK